MVGPQRPVLGALPSWKQSGRVGAASYRLMFSAEEDFGYPAYIVPILAVVKLAAAATILIRFSLVLSDVAYAGMFFHLILAAGAISASRT